MTFRVIERPTSDDLARLGKKDPVNPFLTEQYVEARKLLGSRVVLFAECNDGVIEGGTLGYLQGRTLLPWLEIATAPVGLSDAANFWQGVRTYCSRARVVMVEVGSYGSGSALLPPWSDPVETRSRTEWRVDLGSAELQSFSSNHRRSITKARKAGVIVTRAEGPSAATAHATLMGASMSRRAERGETVPTISPEDEAAIAVFLRTGAGRLYQAIHDGEVVSSLLVLTAPAGAYYQSAGTAARGMEIGAATLVVSEIISRLRDEGLKVFNLSGAGPESPGLQRFKSSFGAQPVSLQAAVYQTAPALLRKARTVVRLAVRDRSRLVRWLVRVERSEVYSADPASLPVNDQPDDRLQKLSCEQLAELASVEPQYQEQLERAIRLGYSGAFGLEVEGAVQHVCWLVDHAADSRNASRNVRLRPGEGEITHCFTPSQYRGRGIYSRAIRAVAEVAASSGMKTIFMIANASNVASLSGIEKAGLHRVGRIYHVRIADRVTMVLRGHRWPLRFAHR